MCRLRPFRSLAPTLLLVWFAGGCAGPDADSVIAYPELSTGVNARSPNLSQSVTGVTVLSWIESVGDDHALRYSRFENSEWSEPATVAAGENWFVNWADFPSVVPISDSLWGAHWLVSQPEGGYAYDVNFSMTTDGGQSWSAPMVPHSDGTPTEHGFVSMYPQEEGIGLVWLDGRNMINEHDPQVVRDGMTLRSAVIAADGSMLHEQVVDELVCDCCQTDVTVTAAGPLLAYRNRTSDEIRDIHVTQAEQGTWQAGVSLSDDHWEIAACPVNGPALAADANRVAVAWFTGTGNVPQVQLAISEDSGRSFSDPVPVATGDNFGHAGVALLADNAVAVSWLRKSAEYEAELVVSVVLHDGSAGDEIVIGRDDAISSYTVPQLDRYEDSLIVAWTAGDYEHSNVRTAIVPLKLLQ